jgi:signal transduction histidine kinase
VRVHVGRHGAYACIEVTDSGPGIPAGELTQIFDEFHRVEAQRHVAGTGLGLTIAHRIVSLHDGHIEVESPPGHGATFRVCLPSRPSTGEVS